jgi:hypothetical protein
VSPAAAPAITARCSADEKLIARALERIRRREQHLLSDAAELNRLYDEHAQLSAEFERHRRSDGAQVCRTCKDLDDAANAAFNAYCRLRSRIGAVA